MEFSVTKLLINNEFTIWKQLPPGSTKYSESRNFIIYEVSAFLIPDLNRKIESGLVPAAKELTDAL